MDIKLGIFSYPLVSTFLEDPSHSFEYPQHKFRLKNKKINLSSPSVAFRS